MSKKVSLNLSSYSIEKLKSSLENMSKQLNNAKKEIPLEIAKNGLSYLDSLYENMEKDENIEDIKTSIKQTTNGCKIISKGKDVIYEEFGTGDKGQASPHPDKGKYSLNPYNSGRKIRNVPENNKWLASHDITSGKYWVYMKDGRLIPTQGVPSGKQMYNTAHYIRKEVVKKVLDKKARDVLSKV